MAVVVAAALTLLWIAHIFAFASKVRLPDEPATVHSTSPLLTPSRRAALPLFAGGLISGVFISVASRRALAQAIGACNFGRCNTCERPFYDRRVFPNGDYYCSRSQLPWQRRTVPLSPNSQLLIMRLY
jgi:hypothetical protein